MRKKPSYEQLEQRVQELEQVEEELRKAEIDLREASRRLRQAQQMAGLGLWDWQISSNALSWSDEVYSIFGRDRHSFHPTVESFEACIHPDDYQNFIAEREAALAGKKTADIEYRIYLPDGSDRYVHEIAKMIRNNNGEVVWVSGTVQDISKRKWEEENLRIYENIISSTPDGIAFLDRAYRYIIVNKSYEKFSGVKKDHFVGKTVAEYLGEDIFLQFVKPNFDKCLRGETIRLQKWFEYPILGKRFVEVTYFPYRDTGHRIIGIVANTRDITEHKLSEEALKMSYRASKLKATISKLFLTSPKSRIFNGIAGLLIGEFESRYGYFGYMDEKGELVSPITAHVLKEKALTMDKMFADSNDSWGDVLDASVENKRLTVRNKAPSLTERKTLHNALIAPLMVEEKLVGLMAVANKPSDYNEEDIKLMESLSEFIAPIVQIFLDKEHAQDQLESNANKLQERNTALNVLIDNQEDEKKTLSDMIHQSFEQLVYPYFNMIKKCKNKDDMFTLLKIIELNASKSLSLLKKTYSEEYRMFTPTEIQVADMIKAGKMSKDIAGILNISPRTVFFHRENIRKKLKLFNSKTNLRTALLSL